MRRRGIVARRAAALLTLAVLCASGCSGGDGADAATSLPPASPATTPRPASTTSGTSSATAADEPKMSSATAREFAKTYIETIDHATYTGDTKPLLDLSTASCDSCLFQSKLIRNVYDNGGKFVGPSSKVLQALTQSFSRSRAQVLVAVSRGDVKQVARNGKTVRVLSSGDETDFLFDLVWRESRWAVDGYEILGGKTGETT